MVAKFKQSNYNTQTGTEYPLALDASVAVLAELAAQFAVSAQDTPNLTVAMRVGRLYKADRTIVEKTAQNSATLTAPTVNPRNDIVYIDATTGTIGVATGAEAASPVDPAIPANKLPKGRIRWTVVAAQITNSMIDDLRFDPPSIEAVLATVVVDGDTAGGVLSGTYPSPGFAVDMATQAELNAVAGAAVNDGDTAGGVLSGTYPSPGFAVDMATQAELNAVAMLPLGIGQDWRDQSVLTGGRVIGTVYQNTTGRSIQLSIFVEIPVPGSGGTTCTFVCDTNSSPSTVVATYSPGGFGVPNQFFLWPIIPPGAYYKLTGNSFIYWKELRDQA